MLIPDRIEAERVSLRKFKKSDLEGFQIFMMHPEMTRFLMFTEKQKTRQGSKELLDSVIESYMLDEPVISYAIVPNEDDDEFMGSCGISPLGNSDIYECYYSLLPEYRGNGYATEAAKALFRHFLLNYEIDEIRAYMHPENTASAGVAERTGMNYAGVKKHPVFNHTAKVFYLKK